jgi:hypothetical protein
MVKKSMILQKKLYQKPLPQKKLEEATVNR